MPLTIHRKQIVIAEEITAGTLAAGITTAANAANLVEEPVIEPNVEFYERAFVYDSLTDTADAATLVTGRVSFRVELRGSAAIATLPSWHTVMRACGFRTAITDIYTLTGALAGGPFRHGEIVTQTTTGATARVMHDTFSGATQLLLEPISGTPNGTDIWTGGSTGATSDVSARVAAGGMTYYPWKEVVKKITIAAAAGGDGWAVGERFKGNTSNARGVVWKAVVDTDTILYYRPIRGTFAAGETLSELDGGGATEVVAGASNEAFEHWPTASMRLIEDGMATTIRGWRGNMALAMSVNRPGLMTFTGPGIIDRATGLNDVVMINGVPYQYGQPPIFHDSVMGFADETVTTVGGEAEPELNEITYDCGCNPQMRLHAGAPGGAVETFVGETRRGTGSIDPEATYSVDTPLNHRVKFVNGTVARLNATVGSVDGNRFKMSMPGIQYSGASPGNRNGILTTRLPFKCTGGELGNLAGGAVTLTSIGGENEFVLTYFHKMS